MKIGLMLGTGEGDAADGMASFAELRDMAQAAEAGGLDSVWAADHLLIREDGATRGIREAWTLLAGLAAVTRRVELGPMVLALPFRNPALTAKMAVELDEVSGGRLVLGVGCGWHEPEFDAFGYPFDHRVARFEEALQVLLPLLREGRVTFEGRYQRAIDVELRPRGPRPSGPPILIAGKRPRMLRLVARYADQWNAAWFGDPTAAVELDRRLEGLRRALDDEGRDPATLTLTAGVLVAFPHLLDSWGGDAPDDDAMSGDPETVARLLAGYAERGITHLIAHAWPRTVEGVLELGRAARLAREMVAAS